MAMLTQLVAKITTEWLKQPYSGYRTLISQYMYE